MMKSIASILMSSCMFMINACEPLRINSIGFSTAIDSHSTGITMMDVPEKQKELFLTGRVTLQSGAVCLSVEDPEGKKVYSDTIKAPSEVYLNRTLVSGPGVWVMRYTSLEGEGSMNLHLSF
jgi:hypothetical protein